LAAIRHIGLPGQCSQVRSGIIACDVRNQRSRPSYSSGVGPIGIEDWAADICTPTAPLPGVDAGGPYLVGSVAQIELEEFVLYGSSCTDLHAQRSRTRR
jgi:hypothetical protein